MSRATPAPGTGPLAGVRVLEMGAVGPAPFACMLLADMGADVVRIERPDATITERGPTLRGRRLLALDLKRNGTEAVQALARQADILIEGYRPGVMERLGLGPETLHAINPALVYGRMTGWGQEGPLSQQAGHDINYISLSGALDAIGSDAAEPAIPLNLVGDYGGGALYLAMGVLAALLEARQSGQGQVVDCAICDGALSLMSLFHQLKAEQRWSGTRASNLLDGGAPFYTTYACADDRRLAIGAIEPQFYAQLREKAGWSDAIFDQQYARENWPLMKERAAAIMRTRTRDAWLSVLGPTDACVTPVLSLEESFQHPHLLARGSFTELQGRSQAAPAPRFSRTPSRATPSEASPAYEQVLTSWSR